MCTAFVSTAELVHRTERQQSLRGATARQGDAMAVQSVASVQLLMPAAAAGLGVGAARSAGKCSTRWRTVRDTAGCAQQWRGPVSKTRSNSCSERGLHGWCSCSRKAAKPRDKSWSVAACTRSEW